MSQNAPRQILELIPLLDKIIAAVITNLMNQFAMSQTDFLDVRRIDDQFAVIGQHGFQLVHTLSSHPKFVIHRWSAGKDGMIGFVTVFDVGLR